MYGNAYLNKFQYCTVNEQIFGGLSQTQSRLGRSAFAKEEATNRQGHWPMILMRITLHLREGVLHRPFSSAPVQ